jgi:hypothetical protein
VVAADQTVISPFRSLSVAAQTQDSPIRNLPLVLPVRHGFRNSHELFPNLLDCHFHRL